MKPKAGLKFIPLPRWIGKIWSQVFCFKTASFIQGGLRHSLIQGAIHRGNQLKPSHPEKMDHSEGWEEGAVVGDGHLCSLAIWKLCEWQRTTSKEKAGALKTQIWFLFNGIGLYPWHLSARSEVNYSAYLSLMRTWQLTGHWSGLLLRQCFSASRRGDVGTAIFSLSTLFYASILKHSAR